MKRLMLALVFLRAGAVCGAENGPRQIRGDIMRVPAMHRSEASVIPAATAPGVSPAGVREQLDRILASPLFKNSKRYPSLLRYVVEQALDGHGSELKERTLGIEVFGRLPDYDTNIDPVVRISAAEIRKRIAQYYHDSAHEDEIRIDIPLGSYVPEFRVPSERAIQRFVEIPEKTAPVSVVPISATVSAEPATAVPAATPAPAFRTRQILLAAAALILLAFVLWMRPWVRTTALDRFWAPMLVKDKTVLLCIGRIHDPDGRPHGVALSDATTMARVSGLLQSKGQPWMIRADSDATFGDLRQGPAVLIGAFNDSWNLRLANSMRFRFHKEGTLNWIEDPQKPQSRAWSGPRDLSVTPINTDFALITLSLI